MELMSLLAIPVNIAIIVFTKKQRMYDDHGYEDVNKTIKSAWYTAQQENNNWSEFNVILFAVAIEHGLLIIKSIIGLTIQDVPKSVTDDEVKRDLTRK